MIAVLLCSLAAGLAVPTTVATTTGGCDDINCWAAPAMGSTRFSAAQLAAAVPIQPAIVKSSSSPTT